MAAGTIVMVGAAGGPTRAVGLQGEFKLIVNPASQVTELRRVDVRALYLKRQTKWPDELLVRPVDLAPATPERIAFSRDVLGLAPAAVTTYWLQEIFAHRAQPPTVVSTVAAAVAFVAATPGAIAYVPTDAPTPGTRVIAIIP